jgi:hypothetical protein
MTKSLNRSQHISLSVTSTEYSELVRIAESYGFSTMTRFITEAINFYVGFQIVKPVKEIPPSILVKHYCSRICTRSPDFESCTHFKDCPLFDVSTSGGWFDKQEEQA